MKLTKLSLCLATLALGIASAASHYTITLTSNMRAGQTELKAGDYKLELEGNQVILKQGKTSIPVTATVEKNANMYRHTAVDSVNSELKSIELGGTNTKLVFSPANATGSTTPAQ